MNGQNEAVIIRERHQRYVEQHPNQRCLKCALRLSQHTVEEFTYCEFVLAGSGMQTLVMNRPDMPDEPLAAQLVKDLEGNS